MDKIRNIGTLDLVGGILCCDFINTVYAWRGENLHEYLGTYQDFIAWCRKLTVTDKKFLEIIDRKAILETKESEKALNRIKEIRLLLYQLIAAVAAKQTKEVTALLPRVNELMAEALSHMQFIYEQQTFIPDFTKEPIDLLAPVWPILYSLYTLLTNEDLVRVKECLRCGWVFLDRTKNGKRRWCDPAECGTADKMKRYYKRKKEEEIKTIKINK